MTVHDRRPKEPTAGRAYTLPVVHEVPLPGSPPASSDSPASEPATVRDLVALSPLARPDRADA